MSEKHSELQYKEINLLNYLVILARHSRLIIFSTLTITLISFCILLFIPNKYKARTRFLPPQQNATLSAQVMDFLGANMSPGSIGLGGGAGQGFATLLGLKTPGDLYVGILRGHNISDKIIDRFDLRNYYSGWKPISTPTIEVIRIKLDKNTIITADKDGLLSIEVIDENPQLAADMANAFVEELDKLLQYLSIEEAKARLIFLEKELAQIKINLANAENSLRIFNEQSNLISIKDQAKGLIEYLAFLKSSIDVKEVQLKVLRQQATDSNYDVVRLETELKGLKDKLKELEKQEGIKANSGEIIIATSKIPGFALETQKLLRDLKYQESLYELYAKLVELTRLDLARDYSVIQIIDRANPPERKFKPKRLTTTLLISIVTFLFLILGVFIREYWNHAVKEQSIVLDQIKEYLKPWGQDAKYLLSKIKRNKIQK